MSFRWRTSQSSITASYCRIYQNLELASCLVLKCLYRFQIWHLSPQQELSRGLLNFKAIGKMWTQISRLQVAFKFWIGPQSLSIDRWINRSDISTHRCVYVYTYIYIYILISKWHIWWRMVTIMGLDLFITLPESIEKNYQIFIKSYGKWIKGRQNLNLICGNCPHIQSPRRYNCKVTGTEK